MAQRRNQATEIATDHAICDGQSLLAANRKAVSKSRLEKLSFFISLYPRCRSANLAGRMRDLLPVELCAGSLQIDQCASDALAAEIGDF